MPQKEKSPAEVLRDLLRKSSKKDSGKGGHNHEESALQRQCVAWFRIQYPKYALNLFAVGNGGVRSAKEAAIMKGEGVTAGVSDLILLLPSGDGKYHGLCIEMKTTDKNSGQTDKQIEWQQAVERAGYKYVVCRTFEEFQKIIIDYLKRP